MYTEDTIINHHGFLRNVEKENKNERNKWTDGAKKTDMNAVGSLYNMVTLSKSYLLSFQPDPDDGQAQKAYKIAKLFGMLRLNIFLIQYWSYYILQN